MRKYFEFRYIILELRKGNAFSIILIGLLWASGKRQTRGYELQERMVFEIYYLKGGFVHSPPTNYNEKVKNARFSYNYCVGHRVRVSTMNILS